MLRSCELRSQAGKSSVAATGESHAVVGEKVARFSQDVAHVADETHDFDAGKQFSKDGAEFARRVS